MINSASRAIFITGATGFIGKPVLARLAASGDHTILCLSRREPSDSRNLRNQSVRYIRGDICNVETYADNLAGVHTVVHMAAATGTASESELNRVNVHGTAQLLDACKRAGIRQFVFMSSIAAAAGDLTNYPYGRTKLEAEGIVLDSGLPCRIVRPTIVLSELGGNWAVLRKLACLPIIPVFGGGIARVQPVDLADVARGVEWLLVGPQNGDALIELGGPEVLTFADLLLRIRQACGRRGGILLPIPLGPTRVLLDFARRILGENLPITAGQLEPFVADGVATSNFVAKRLRPEMVSLDALLARIAHAR